MIKFIFKYLLPLGFILVTGVVGYNYFYGTPEEQENSKQIIAKVQGLGSEIMNLLASEKEKFNAGKYDDAIDKISDSLNYLKQKAAKLSTSDNEWIDELEAEKRELQQALASLNSAAAQTADNTPATNGRSRSALDPDQIQRRINALAKHTEELGLRISHKN